MWRLLLGVVLLALVARPQVVAADEGCPGDAYTPEDTASALFGQFLVNGQWDLAYEVLHPEAQLRVPMFAFAAARQAGAVMGPILDVEVGPARWYPGWTWGWTGLNFTTMAEVPVRFTRGFGPAAVPSYEVVPLVQVGDCWRWVPPALP